MSTILYLEDEATIAEVTKEYMQMQGYDVRHVIDGEHAIKLLEETEIDLAILDIMVPKISGIDVLKEIKNKGYHFPVIMLSALGDEMTQLQAFNLFADDYIVKPFSPILLLKRIEALFRRMPQTSKLSSTETNNKLVLEAESYQAYVNDVSLNLTVTEFYILHALHQYPQKVFTRDDLLEVAFGDEYYPNDRVIDAHIKNIRKKLPQQYIKTIIGAGYQFVQEV